jgi:hypothetical protein
MKNLSAQTRRITVVLLALASLFIFLAPRVEAANGPFNGKIAFMSGRDGNLEVYVMNADGTGQVNISNNPTDDTHPVWSPNGTKIAFNGHRDGTFSEIYVMNADGSNQTRLTFNNATDGVGSWSPDGTKIAFQSNRDGNFEIYVMNADGSNQTRLTNNLVNDLAPAWSPDGKRIAFYSNRDGSDEIYVINADGSNQTRLTNNTVLDQFPSFSPDGTKILFQRHVQNQPQIFSMNADGTNPVQLTSAGANFGPAGFSPDSAKITFDSNRDSGSNPNNSEIYVMDANGANQTRLTNNPALDSSPTWQPLFSPESVGVFRPSTGQWFLRNTPTAGAPNVTLSFGQAGDLPVTGDWDGDGRTDIGVFRNGTFLLALLKTIFTHPCFTCPLVPITTVEPLPSFNFGQAGDLPVAGDWNGDGVDDVGVFRVGQFSLRQPITIKPCLACPPIIITINPNFGEVTDLPVVGDWNGDRTDTVGVFRGGPNGDWFLRNSNTTGVTDIHVQQFGSLAGVLYVVGDWDGDGADTVGLLFNGSFFLRNTNTDGPDSDLIFSSFAQAGDLPVAGDWNGANTPPNSGVNNPSDGSSHVGQTQTFTTTCSDPDGWHDISTIDFKIAKSDGNGNGVPLALWVQFDEGSKLVRFYNPDSQTWDEGAPGSNVVLSNRFAEINLAQTSVQGSGPTGPSVQITWSIVFKDAARMNNYKQYLKITDDAGLTTGFDKVGSWSVAR